MAGNELVLDLTNYRDRIGSRVPPGRYKVLVEDLEKDQAKSGNTMVNVYLRVIEGEYKDSNLVDRLVLTPKSLFRVVGFMQALGLKTPRQRLQINLDQWRNKVLFVQVDDGEPFNGTVKSEIRGYERVPKSAASAEESSEFEAYDASQQSGIMDSPAPADDPVNDREQPADDSDVDLSTLQL